MQDMTLTLTSKQVRAVRTMLQVIIHADDALDWLTNGSKELREVHAMLVQQSDEAATESAPS